MKSKNIFIMQNINTIAKHAKQASRALATAKPAQKNHALRELARLIKKNKAQIQRENKRDISFAKSKGRDSHMIDRLVLKDQYIREMLAGIKDIINWPDPVGRVIEKRNMINGVPLKKVTTPLGVVGIIYESRPNVSIDAAALCVKSGNACILKGGSESLNTNRMLTKVARKALTKARLPENAVQFLDTRDREKVRELLRQNEYIDVIIPRGGYDLIKTVLKYSSIPTLYHADGLDHVYVDKSADLKKVVDIIVNAKVQRPTVCNALDTILVHEKIAKKALPLLAKILSKKGVEMRCDKESYEIIVGAENLQPLQGRIKRVSKKDYSTEFLSLKLAIKVVKNTEEAIDHINTHGSKHTEGIVAQDKKALEKFAASVDAAAIMQNCSTRLHDGYIFGLGAEMGINTGKLHARGPVGINELTTYKWIAEGRGEIRE